MRSAAALGTAALLLLAAFPAAAAPPNSDGAYHIVLSRSSVSAGEQVEMRLVPPVPPGARVSWPVAVGSTQLIYAAVFRAPYVIPAGTPPAKVSVSISGPGVRSIVSTEIALVPSSVP